MDAPHALLHHAQDVMIYIGYMGQIVKHVITVLLALIQQGNAQLVFLLLYWLELLAEAACQDNIMMSLLLFALNVLQIVILAQMILLAKFVLLLIIWLEIFVELALQTNIMKVV